MSGIFEGEEFQKGTASRPLQYVYNLGLGVSQAISSVIGWDPDESVSSNCGKASCSVTIRLNNGKEPAVLMWVFGRLIRDVLDAVLGEGHCERSIETDEGRKALWRPYD